MHRFRSTIRTPVKRQGSDQYLLLTLISFAISITLTRLFLQLTGYPKLGRGELHIAHVLWGGLLLFIASILPLLIANRWVYVVGAILAGTGVGLFIDEVGKFITQNNNYFYPLAAPIIYAFFLLTVMLYLRIRRPPSHEPRAELYRAMDAMEEVLEHDLDPQERDRLEARLRYVAAAPNQPELSQLASDLLDFLQSEQLTLVPQRDTLWGKLLEVWRRFEARWVTERRLRAAIAGGLLALGFMGLVTIVQSLPIGNDASLQRQLTHLIQEGQLSGPNGLAWFMARLALETSVGILLLISAGLLVVGKSRAGIFFGSLSLLLSLTGVNLLVFYFEQFSAIVTASVQLGLLLTTAYYRQRYLAPPHPSLKPPDLDESSQDEPSLPGQVDGPSSKRT